MNSLAKMSNINIMIAIGLLFLIIFAIMYYKKNAENLTFNYIPHHINSKWDKCYNNCDNILDQAKFEICKENCNKKYLY